MKIPDLDEFLKSLNKFGIVINCAGIGAGKLQGQPDDVIPIRGQVVRVKAPWMNNIFFWGTSYIIPNLDSVVLGGTAQRGNWDTSVYQSDTDKILSDVYELFPSMKVAPIDNVWVGLRPGRTPLRLDSEVRHGKLMIHNYGHGGSGVTLAMGCADDVLQNHIIPNLNKEFKLAEIGKAKL